MILPSPLGLFPLCFLVLFNSDWFSPYDIILYLLYYIPLQAFFLFSNERQNENGSRWEGKWKEIEGT